MHNKKRGIITILTDFGHKDPFVGAMKGVILGINPDAIIVDLTHEISPQDVFEGAFDLCQAYKYFPPGTVHIAVVDPGVGGERRAIIADTGPYLFVAPDNGLISLAVGDHCDNPRVFEINDSRYLPKEISTTFHGRDIFAPAGARLSLGVKPESLGLEAGDFERVYIPALEFKEGRAVGYVIHIDKFGNLITNIEKGLSRRIARININGRVIEKVRSFYNQGTPGEIIAVTGSTDYIEISVNRENAARVLGIKKGQEITVDLK